MQEKYIITTAQLEIEEEALESGYYFSRYYKGTERHKCDALQLTSGYGLFIDIYDDGDDFAVIIKYKEKMYIEYANKEKISELLKKIRFTGYYLAKHYEK